MKKSTRSVLYNYMDMTGVFIDDERVFTVTEFKVTEEGFKMISGGCHHFDTLREARIWVSKNIHMFDPRIVYTRSVLEAANTLYSPGDLAKNLIERHGTDYLFFCKKYADYMGKMPQIKFRYDDQNYTYPCDFSYLNGLGISTAGIYGAGELPYVDSTFQRAVSVRSTPFTEFFETKSLDGYRMLMLASYAVENRSSWRERRDQRRKEKAA